MNRLHPWVASALTALAAVVSAADQPIDLTTTLRLAGANNLEIRIARERLAEAKADADSARDRLYPWVTLQISARQHENNIQAVDGKLLDADKRSLAAGIGLNTQWDFGEIYYQQLAAKQRARAEDAGLATQRLTTTTAAALAYYDLLRAASLADIAKDALALSTRHQSQLESAASAGLAFAGDVQRVATQRARNEALLQQARENARTASVRLADILRLDPTIEFVPAPAELVATILVPTDTDLATLIARALATRPELTQADARLSAIRELHNAVRTAPLIPTLSAQANVGGLGGDAGLGSWSHGFDSSNDYGIGLSWRVGPGGLFDRNRVRSSEARLRRGALELELVQDQIRRQVVEQHIRAQSLSAQLASFRAALEAAEKTARLSRERREQAVGGVLEDLLAEQELTQARRDYVTAVALFNQAEHSLLRALGGESTTRP